MCAYNVVEHGFCSRLQMCCMFEHVCCLRSVTHHSENNVWLTMCVPKCMNMLFIMCCLKICCEHVVVHNVCSWGVLQNYESVMCSSVVKGSTLASTTHVAVNTEIAEWWKNDTPNKRNQRHNSTHFNISRHQHHAHSNGNILRIVCVARFLCVVEQVCFQCGWKWVCFSVEKSPLFWTCVLLSMTSLTRCVWSNIWKYVFRP